MIQPGLEVNIGTVNPTVNVNLGSNPRDNGNLNFSDVVGLANSISEAKDNIEDYFGASLPSFTKSTQISSTVYIQNACMHEDILPDVLQCAQQLYISWILSAVNLNAVIGTSRTKVRDALKVVATEDWFNNLIKEHVDTKDIVSGIENFGMFADNSQSYNKHLTVKTGTNSELTKTMNKSLDLPVSRVIELKLNGDSDKTYIINALVNLYPQFIPEEVLREYVKLGRKASLAERWFKVRTGEYQFWKDFIFEIGDAERRASAIKKDSTGLLRNMIDKQQSNFSKWISKVFFNSTRALSAGSAPSGFGSRQNVANSILVFSKPDFERWTKEANINFKMENDRNAFMFKTMSMMVIVIDSDFQMVEMYYHGIRNKGEFTFKQIQSQSKTEKYDLAYLMKAFSTVNSPKF